MSRAFVKESDDDVVSGELPERPVSNQPNYVTARGMEQLRQRVHELAAQHEQLKAVAENDSEAKRKLREVERDQRYFLAQLERAEVVDPTKHPADTVRFGAQVSMTDADGATHVVTIVGVDEADVAAGLVSWDSPLAHALIGAKVGDTVKWRRPAGETEVEVMGIVYK